MAMRSLLAQPSAQRQRGLGLTQAAALARPGQDETCARCRVTCHGVKAPSDSCFCLCSWTCTATLARATAASPTRTRTRRRRLARAAVAAAAAAGAGWRGWAPAWRCGRGTPPRAARRTQARCPSCAVRGRWARVPRRIVVQRCWARLRVPARPPALRAIVASMLARARSAWDGHSVQATDRPSQVSASTYIFQGELSAECAPLHGAAQPRF